MFKTNEINCKLCGNVAANRDKYLENYFCVPRGYPVTQFQALKNSLAHRSIGNNFLENFKIKIEICSIKMLKAIQLPPSNYLITCYQTLDEVTWLLRKKNKYKCIEKNLKKSKFYQNF